MCVNRLRTKTRINATHLIVDPVGWRTEVEEGTMAAAAAAAPGILGDEQC